MLGFLLGTSIPIVPFPGIGAIILIPKADNERAISSSKFLILEIRIPASGTISYSVTVGPIVALIFAVSYTHLPSPRDRTRSRMPSSA